MGMLDGLFDSPDAQFFAGLLGGQSPNFGQNILQALQFQKQMQEAAQRQKIAQMQLESGGLDLQQKKQSVADDAQAREIARRFQAQQQQPSVYGGDMPAGTEMPSGMPRPGMPTKMDTANRYEAMANEFDKAGLPQKAEAYRQLAEKYRPKLKETKTLVDKATGERVSVNVFEDGTQQVMPFSPDKEKAHFADVGNGIMPVDPYTGKPMGTVLDKSASPDAQLSAETTRRGQNMTDARAGQHYDAERGVVVNTGTGTASPVTMGGQPLPQQMPASTKKEMADIDSQLGIVRGGIKAAEGTPSAFGMKRGLATLAGTIPESVAGRMDSDQERQARSYVYNVVSGVIKERAGSAQTPQELARLRTFLPAETDNNKQVSDKLRAFEQYLVDKRNAYGASNPTKPASAGGWSIRPLP